VILTVDIGNTETVLGLFEGRDAVQVWRVATERNRTADEVALLVHGLLGADGIDATDRIVVGSVVPVLNRAWSAMAENLGFPLQFLDGTSSVPIRLEVDHASQVGADRIANTLAAVELFSRDTIVVDLGTATTFDCISADGVFLGGVIAPGPRTALDQLTRSAAQLPQVELQPPVRVIGTNTLACLLSGGFYGAVDGIDGIVKRILKEWGREKPLVVATGGLADVVAPHCQSVDQIEPVLTVTGLAIADRYLFD
jgi:type III pantothenate kinase